MSKFKNEGEAFAYVVQTKRYKRTTQIGKATFTICLIGFLFWAMLALTRWVLE